ncbi:MAG: VOC family protein [Calditrichota bacterium]
MFRLILTICIILSTLQAQPLHQRLVLDHVNIAVKDLPKAVSFFEDTLGFAIKPGRLHKNSIDNAHVKFKDGSSLEFITASEPRDTLAKYYLDRIEK